MGEIDLNDLDDETRRGAEILWRASQSADLFTSPTEEMLMDNFIRLRDVIRNNLQNKFNVPENELDDAATTIAMKFDPEGYAAIDKWADMQEVFRFQK